MDQTLEVVLGATSADGTQRNQRSGIRFLYSVNYLQIADTPDIVSCLDSKDFWISWHGGRILVGKGREYGHGQILEPYEYDDYLIQNVGFATSGSSPGVWTVKENMGKFYP